MSEVCDLCGMRTANPARHRAKYKEQHAEIMAQREAESKPLPPAPPPETKKESILGKAAKWLKTT